MTQASESPGKSVRKGYWKKERKIIQAKSKQDVKLDSQGKEAVHLGISLLRSHNPQETNTSYFTKSCFEIAWLLPKGLHTLSKKCILYSACYNPCGLLLDPFFILRHQKETLKKLQQVLGRINPIPAQDRVTANGIGRTACRLYKGLDPANV